MEINTFKYTIANDKHCIDKAMKRKSIETGEITTFEKVTFKQNELKVTAGMRLSGGIASQREIACTKALSCLPDSKAAKGCWIPYPALGNYNLQMPRLTTAVPGTSALCSVRAVMYLQSAGNRLFPLL